ncbi:MAG: hypothetical protein ACKOEQ_05695 [Verrucomicrobiota bacterium]
MGQYPAAARWLRAEVVRDGTGRAIELELSCPVRDGEHPTLATGAYLLRTNCTETEPATLWRWCMQLTQAEAAFRTAKSDIGLWPVFHRKSERVDAHLLVCFPSLALWRTLEMWMRGKRLGTSAWKLVEAAGTIRSMDVSVPVNLETAVGQSVGRVPSRGDDDAACPVRRVRGPGLQPRRAHHDLTRRVSPWVPAREPILPDGRALSSF